MKGEIIMIGEDYGVKWSDLHSFAHGTLYNETILKDNDLKGHKLGDYVDIEFITTHYEEDFHPCNLAVIRDGESELIGNGYQKIEKEREENEFREQIKLMVHNMHVTQKELEFQLDKKPSGYVIRVNDEHGCILRICKIPFHLVEDKNGVKGFIDIEYHD